MQWRTLHPPQRGEADQGSGVRKRAASRLCAAGTGVHKQPGDSTSSSLSSLLVSRASPRVPENLQCKPAALPVCAPPLPLLFYMKFVVAFVVDLPPRSLSLGPVSVPQKGPPRETHHNAPVPPSLWEAETATDWKPSAHSRFSPFPCTVSVSLR